MDAVSLVVSALNAGAKTERTKADPAARDIYDRLKLMIFPVVLTVDEYEKDPDTWQAPLAKVLIDSGADNPQLIQTARQLLELLDS